MLSIACFRAFGNFRLCSSSSFSFPLFSSYSFPLPFSNLLIPLYSSLALNGSQLFPKIGFMVNPIEGLGQSLSCGFVSIRPQFKEFIYSYFPFSDCFIVDGHFSYRLGFLKIGFTAYCSFKTRFEAMVVLLGVEL